MSDKYGIGTCPDHGNYVYRELHGDHCPMCSTIANQKREIARLRERIEKLEAKLEASDTVAGYATALAEEFELAVASRNPVSGMQVTPAGDFISAAQLPSVLRRMEWWAREIRKVDADRAALGEVK